MSQKTVRVGDVMRRKFVVVDGIITVVDAIRRMSAENTDELIVDRRHDDDEFGLLLIADIAKQVMAANRAPERVSVYEIMSKPVITVDPVMKARYCARLFSNVGISTAPVLREDKIVGIVSYRELVFGAMAEAAGVKTGSADDG